MLGYDIAEGIGIHTNVVIRLSPSPNTLGSIIENQNKFQYYAALYYRFSQSTLSRA